MNKSKVRFSVSADKFDLIPGKLIAYWVSDQLHQHFGGRTINDIAVASVGIQTGDNNKFIHFWWEVQFPNICFSARSVEDSFDECSWFPYNKGGEFRKWYGNNDNVVKWKNDGSEVKSNSIATGHHYQQYSDDLKFKPMVTWSRIATGKPAFRVKSYGFLSDMAGFSLYAHSDKISYLCGLCNSVVAEKYLSFMAPTLNIMTGPVLDIPIVEKREDEINEVVQNCVAISKDDWDSFETSNDFKRHPLL